MLSYKFDSLSWFQLIGEKGRRIRQLTSVVQKCFKFPENIVELYAEKVNNRGLCAIGQAESLRYKLLERREGLIGKPYLFFVNCLLVEYLNMFGELNILGD